MKKVIICIAALTAILFGISTVGCSSGEDTWEEYTEWRNANDEWLQQMRALKNDDGTPYYETVVPSWNPDQYVLIHYFNDRSETAGNLSPMYTSTVDVRYKLHLYDGTPADSSDLITSNGAPGIFRTKLSATISGWPIALETMHCGDTVEVIVPYQSGYGATELETIKPFSNLRFNIRLVDIPYYELAPYE